MLPWINTLLTFILQKHLYQRRNRYLEEGINDFESKYDVTLDQIQELSTILDEESIRINIIVDFAILKANLERLMYIFWIMFLSGTLMMIAQQKIPPNHWVEFITPLTLSLISWLGSCLTIPILYIGRVIGAINSEIVRYVRRNNILLKELHPTETTNLLET